MKIARVSSTKRGETDRLLSTLVDQLQGQGRHLAGVVKDQSHQSQFANGCDMKVRVLPDGPVIRITQDLGAGSDACRLDPSAIVEAVSEVERRPLEGVELFILNKFGPEEAAGHGFCSVIGAAIEQGIPVLVGIGPANSAAFDRFAGGLATPLADEADALASWCQEVMSEAATAS